MADTTVLTLREAAFVFGDSLKNISRTVDEHAGLAVTLTRGKRNVRVLRMPDLIYLQALNDVGHLLTPQGRRALHEALLSGRSANQVIVGGFSLPLAQLRNEVVRRLGTLNRLKNSVDGNPDDPLIKGTSVEVYRISALLDGGAEIDAVLRDYPGLTRAEVQLASDYARAIPKKGRPYPKISFKRAIVTLGLDALDELAVEE
ncbi:DUF433 domain-containing protein [Massilia rubra]|uniref:DUF433 domain-containing protein n=1 Tax=Massilia rubra TaxID=2607910 RepID=A0ABX0M052_9BURK|nr:DUF433 domain-containing protein [Massilia rubra]NHZ37552.1 DUF433 domain-containing protein [Massilia rubra]